MTGLPSKTTLTLLTLGVILTLPSVVPSLANYKSLDWNDAPQVLDFIPRDMSASPLEDEAARMNPSLASTAGAAGRLSDPQHNLDSFYAALHHVELRHPDAIARILHYGDSPTTADLITADARSALQRLFGDAGHGFYLIARPWAWYGHRGVDSDAAGWKIDPANQAELKDGLYGLGGVSFRGREGSWSRITLRDGGQTRVEISFLRQPRGGAFVVMSETGVLGTVDTSGDRVEPGYAAFPLSEEAHEVEVKVTAGEVRLFGYYLENAGPGLVYSSLGLNGAYVAVPARMFNEKLWTEELRHYKPDLVIVNYGTNESVYPAFVDQSMVKETKEVVRRIREAMPGVAVLIMSPMDRGQKGSGGEIVTVPVMSRLVTLQEGAAKDLGCAFFNTFQAMGGSGTMAKWYHAEPRLVGGDFIHPMPAGARIVGNLLETALLDGYNRFKLRHMQDQIAKTAVPELKR